MTVSKKKTPVKKPVKKDTPAADAPEVQPPTLVQAMNQDALRFVMAIIDQADCKGSDAINIVNLKREMIRLSGGVPE